MRHQGTPKTTSVLRALGLAGVLAAIGCQPHYDGLEVRYLNGTGEFDSNGLEIREGQALAIEVTPLSDNRYEDYEDFDIVELSSFNPNVLIAAPSTDTNRFVLIGVSIGETDVDVEINGRDVDTIPAKVVAQQGGAP